jgi:hypothetical protein
MDLLRRDVVDSMCQSMTGCADQDKQEFWYWVDDMQINERQTWIDYESPQDIINNLYYWYPGQSDTIDSLQYGLNQIVAQYGRRRNLKDIGNRFLDEHWDENWDENWDEHWDEH